MTKDRDVAELALRQHGVFTRRQAVRLGITNKMIAIRLQKGTWERVDRAVFRFAGTPRSWHARVAAACFAGPAVASHRSAGLLWKFPEMPAEIVEVTALRHRRRRAGDVTWHESYLLTPEQVTEIDGIQTTSGLRTFLDLAGVLGSEPLEVVCNEGIRRGLFNVHGALAMLERLGPLRRGAPMARAILESRRPDDRRPESVLETRFLQLVRNAGLREPVSQYEIRVGDRMLRLDFAYPDARLAIELDGDEFHWGERVSDRDQDRVNLLSGIGWRVQRFTWTDIQNHPYRVIARLEPALRLTA